MSLLKQIHDWSISLTPCLRDAIRRLNEKQALDDSDFDDLYALLKCDAGIPDQTKRTAKPFDVGHIADDTGAGPSVVLKALRSLKNVNRIAEAQTLRFVPLGLTVVYGDNGTGKSGYSRVLKLACRARDEKSTVLPNAHLPKEKQGIPEAEFVVEVAGSEKTLSWKLGADTHSELAGLSVFDSHCARAYLDAEQDVAYLPYGLDLVEGLGQSVLPELTLRLEAEIATCVVDPTTFKDLASDTSVGQLISSMSHLTDKTKIEQLAEFGEDEVLRHQELIEMLREQDPKARAIGLRRFRDRLKSVHSKMVAAQSQFNQQTIDNLKQLFADQQTALAAEELAAQNLQAGESLLPGTGGPEWKLLFESARAFAQTALGNAAFPESNSDNRCVLCQQELRDGGERLIRFSEFLKNDTAKTAKIKRAECIQATAVIEKANIGIGLESSLIEEVDQYEPGLSAKLLPFETELGKLRDWILEAVKSNKWIDAPQLSVEPIQEALRVVNDLDTKATEHDLASNEEARSKLIKELAELDARKRLSPRRQAVLSAIDRLVLKNKLESCKTHLKSRPISDKSKELTDKAVTDALRDALNQEFESLGITQLRAKLTNRVSGGRTLHKLVLDVPAPCKLSDILSEGELRVLAIASFLAELSLSSGAAGAVFDDPVSSLDHLRRARVAERLVKESQRRQVIVFTHDTVFLSELRSCVDALQSQAAYYHLQWIAEGFAGSCNEGLPWDHQGHKQRLDSLGKDQRALQRSWTPVPTSELSKQMRTVYSDLRATIERVVETVILCGTVKRFERYIPVEHLKGVIGFTAAEYNEVHRLFKKACNITNAHDPASGANVPIPDPAELLIDITALDSLIDLVTKRTTLSRKLP